MISLGILVLVLTKMCLGSIIINPKECSNLKDNPLCCLHPQIEKEAKLAENCCKWFKYCPTSYVIGKLYNTGCCKKKLIIDSIKTLKFLTLHSMIKGYN